MTMLAGILILQQPQWYLDYGEASWKKDAIEYVENADGKGLNTFGKSLLPSVFQPRPCRAGVNACPDRYTLTVNRGKDPRRSTPSWVFWAGFISGLCLVVMAWEREFPGIRPCWSSLFPTAPSTCKAPPSCLHVLRLKSTFESWPLTLAGPTTPSSLTW